MATKLKTRNNLNVFYNKHKSLLLCKIVLDTQPDSNSLPTAAFRKLNLFFMLFYTPSPQTFSSSVRVRRRMRMMKLTWDFHKQIFLSNYHPNSSCWQQI